MNMVKCPICNQETDDLTTHFKNNPECVKAAILTIKTFTEWLESVIKPILEWLTELSEYRG